VLSDREIEISGLVSHEFTNDQIGEKLNISETTVKTHLEIYIQKLVFTIELLWLFVF
jgi:ATP/maltotriose-dependent transcriptional regulator MalT